MLVLIDNYDSFTFNIVQAFQKLNQPLVVLRNHVSLNAVLQYKPTSIVIGPGPGNPSEAGISKECILELGKTIPTLGICLGHQAIGEVFGADVIKASYPMHGKTSDIHHNHQGVFKDLPQPLLAARYHSLIVDSLPSCLEATAHTKSGEIMGLRHKLFPIVGVQFHPESIATPCGLQLLSNFLEQKP